jgi:hypothetical protein
MKKLAFLFVFLIAATLVNAESKTEIKKSDLPKTITDNLALNYSGFTVQRVFKIVDNNVTSYQIIIAKGSERDRLYYDADGSFWKKEPIEHLANKESHMTNKSTHMNNDAGMNKTPQNKK